MEEKTAASGSAQATPAGQAPHPPVMDVAPPSGQPRQTPPVSAAKGVRPAPPPEKTGEEPAKSKQAKPAATPKRPKTGQPGVGMAITATVIIVLGLAVLATIAYLKTQK